MFCTKCGEDKALTEFPWRVKSKGTHTCHCKKCTAACSKDWYARNKESHKLYVSTHRHRYLEEKFSLVREFFSTGCAHCGELNPIVLEAHHYSGERDFTISAARRVSTKSLIEELKKCVPLCANCHKIEHVRLLLVGR